MSFRHPRQWDRRTKLLAVGIGQSFLLALVAFRGLFGPGYLLHSDFITPLRYTPTFFARFISTWDPVTGGFSYNAPKLVVQLPVALLVWAGVSTALLYKLIVVVILGLTGATMFALVFGRAARMTDPGRAYFAGTVASLLFVANPWTINQIHHHFWLVLGVGLLPTIYAVYARALDGRGGLGALFVLAVCFLAEATQPHSLFIYVLPVGAFAFLVHVLEAPSIERTLSAIRVTVAMLVVAVLVNAVWLVPFVYVAIHTAPSPGTYLLTVENVVTMSGHASILRAEQLRGAMGMGLKGLLAPGVATSFVTHVPILDRLWPVVGIGLVAFPFVGLLGGRRRVTRDHLAFAAVAVVGLILTTGTQAPFGDIYQWATLSLPMGWMLRAPWKFGGLFVFGLAALAGLATADVLVALASLRRGAHRRTLRLALWPVEFAVRPRPIGPVGEGGAAAVVVAALLLATSLHGWALFTGDLNGHVQPTQVPEDYATTLDWLAATDGGGRVLWLPDDHLSVRNERYFWYNWTSAWNRWFLRGNRFLEFTTPGHVLPGTPRNEEFLLWLLERLQTGTVSNPSTMLREVGVSTVVVHEDTSNGTMPGTIRRRLLADPAITEVYRSGDVHVLHVDGASLIHAGSAVGSDSLDSFAALSASTARTGGADGAGSPAVLTDGGTAADVHGLVSAGDASPLYLGAGTTVAPFRYTDHHDPATRWSKAQPSDPFQGQWHTYLARRGIDSWQTDFGRGIAFTWADQRVPTIVPVSGSTTLATWDFTNASVPPGWTSLDAGQGLAVADAHLVVTLDRSAGRWKRVASPPVNVTADGVYRFRFDLHGGPVQDLHVKVAEYDANGTLLGDHRVAAFGSGSVDERAVRVDYVPRDPRTTSVRLQFWQDHAQGQPLPARYTIDTVSVADVSAAATPASLSMPVAADHAGTYSLAARVFENADGGRLRVLVDGHPYTVETKATMNRFVWVPLGTATLSAGRHTVTIENVDGFNAVNLLSVVPTADLARQRARLDARLRNQSVVYTFSAARDMRTRSSATVSLGTADQSRPAISLGTDGLAWRTVDVLKSGQYALRVTGNGTFVVYVDDRSYLFDGTVDDGRRLATVYLASGEHRLDVTPIERTVATVDPSVATGLTGGDANGTATWSPDGPDWRGSLRVETNATTRSWSWIDTEPVTVTPDRSYRIETSLRLRNANQSHVVVEGYDRAANRWTRLGTVPDGQVGTADWESFDGTVDVPPGVDRIRFVINAGWVANASDGPATTWFGPITVRGVENNTVESVTLTSAPNDGTAGSVVRSNGTTASVVSYRELSPTAYSVRVNASGPYVLSFGQDFDPLWVAEVHTPEGVVGYEPVRVATAATGFPIDRTGDYTITVRYRPQRPFVYGSVISGATALALLFLVGRRRRRGPGDGPRPRGLDRRRWGERLRRWLRRGRP